VREKRKENRGESQLKTNLDVPSIKYKDIYTIVEGIHRKFEVDISNFGFYRGARAPGNSGVGQIKIRFFFILNPFLLII
jgi:hypothetical protein